MLPRGSLVASLTFRKSMHLSSLFVKISTEVLISFKKHPPRPKSLFSKYDWQEQALWTVQTIQSQVSLGSAHSFSRWANIFSYRCYSQVSFEADPANLPNKIFSLSKLLSYLWTPLGHGFLYHIGRADIHKTQFTSIFQICYQIYLHTSHTQ